MTRYRYNLVEVNIANCTTKEVIKILEYCKEIVLKIYNSKKNDLLEEITIIDSDNNKKKNYYIRAGYSVMSNSYHRDSYYISFEDKKYKSKRVKVIAKLKILKDYG